MSESDAIDDHDPMEETEIHAFSFYSCISSTVGSLLVLLLFSLNRELRKFAFKLILFVCVSDLMISSLSLLATLGRSSINEPESFACKLEAVVTNYFNLTSILSTTAISNALLRAVTTKGVKIGSLTVERSLTGYLLYVFGMPTLLTLIPFVTDDYGGTDEWCWIVVDETNPIRGKVLRLIEFYIPLWAAILYNLFAVLKALSYWDAVMDSEYRANYLKRLISFPIIMMICWTCATVHRIHSIFSTEKLRALAVLHVVFGDLQGCFNALAFLLIADVRKVLRKRVCWWICPVSSKKAANNTSVIGQDIQQILGSSHGNKDGHAYELHHINESHSLTNPTSPQSSSR